MKIWMPLISTGTGAEVYADRLAALLSDRGHEVRLAKAPHRFQYAPWLANLRAPDDIDVVFANSWSARAFAGNKPLVTVVHHVAVDPAGDALKSTAQSVFHHGFVKPMEKAAIRRSKRVVAVSQTTADSIQKYLLSCDVDVVPPGIDTEFFVPDPDAQFGNEQGQIRLLFVGKPSQRKGFDTVRSIVDRLGDKAVLTCVGTPPPKEERCPNTRYLGRVSEEDLRRAYQSSDMLLFPSRLEGFGYVAAEALACGLPVVCSTGTAVQETCGEGPHGIFAPPGDVEGFCKAIVSNWEANPDLKNMRRFARTRAETAFNYDLWAEGMEQILLQASEGGHQG